MTRCKRRRKTLIHALDGQLALLVTRLNCMFSTPGKWTKRQPCTLHWPDTA